MGRPVKADTVEGSGVRAHVFDFHYRGLDRGGSGNKE